jgi:hypothetical protein
MRKIGAALLLAAMLTGCSGVSDEDRQKAEDFCAGEGDRVWDGGMGIDRYENPEGFDRCVEDAAPVADCLDEAKGSGSLPPLIPESC